MTLLTNARIQVLGGLNPIRLLEPVLSLKPVLADSFEREMLKDGLKQLAGEFNSSLSYLLCLLRANLLALEIPFNPLDDYDLNGKRHNLSEYLKAMIALKKIPRCNSLLSDVRYFFKYFRWYMSGQKSQAENACREYIKARIKTHSVTRGLKKESSLDANIVTRRINSQVKKEVARERGKEIKSQFPKISLDEIAEMITEEMNIGPNSTP
ncbi:hypothetical protein AB4383_13650, partial [Vibrio breoganii]